MCKVRLGKRQKGAEIRIYFVMISFVRPLPRNNLPGRLWITFLISPLPLSQRLEFYW